MRRSIPILLGFLAGIVATLLGFGTDTGGYWAIAALAFAGYIVGLLEGEFRMNLSWPLLLLWSLAWGAREFYILYTQPAES